MIRNDVLQGDVGFVVGGGRKKGDGGLVYLSRSPCAQLLLRETGWIQSFSQTPGVVPRSFSYQRSRWEELLLQSWPHRTHLPNKFFTYAIFAKTFNPLKKDEEKNLKLFTAFSSPLCLFSLSTTHFPKIHFLSHLLLLQKIAFLNLMKQGAWMNANTISCSVSVCVCLCRRLSVSLSQSFSVSFSKSLPVSAKKLAVGWL